MSTITININNSGTVDIMSDNNGIKSNKTVSLQYFLSTFASTYATFETPVMPNNCRKIIKSSNAELYIFEYPPSYRDIKYNNEVIKNVYCPRTIFAIKITGDSKKNFSKACLWIADPITPFSMSMPLRNWHFNNYSYSYHGSSICWGSGQDTLNRILSSDPSTYGSIFNLYMSLTFNEHLSAYVNLPSFLRIGSDPDVKGDQMYKICKSLEGAKFFPLDAVELSTMTLTQMCADFTAGKF